jgi:hypothetical protein
MEVIIVLLPSGAYIGSYLSTTQSHGVTRDEYALLPDTQHPGTFHWPIDVEKVPRTSDSRVSRHSGTPISPHNLSSRYILRSYCDFRGSVRDAVSIPVNTQLHSYGLG